MTMTDREKPLTERTMPDLRAIIDRLHADRERYDRANRIVEARSCELEIAEATRALAIINRRATEAEDQRAATLTEERVREVVRSAATALLEERKLYIVKTQQPSMNDIVLEAYGHGRACDAIALQGDDLQAVLDAIATRAAKELAGAVVALDAQERAQLTAMLDDGAASDYPAAYQAILRLLAAADAAPRGCPVHDGAIHGGEAEELRAGIEALIADPPGGDLESNREWMLPLQRLLDRVNARDSLGYLERGDEQRETDLREAFLAGFAFAEDKADISEHDGWHRTDPRIEWPSHGQREDAAAEYARSKAGG